MSVTVDPLLPLSLLEAVRVVDTPDELDADFVAELRNKRLGLSDTVYTQIRRWSDAVKRRQRGAHDEAVALARLIGRRPDAEAIFRAAGRYVARELYGTVAPATRRMLLVLPALLARPLALRQARRIARVQLDGGLRRVGGQLLLTIPNSITLDAAPRAAGCAYYEAFLRELLRLLIDVQGAVEHVRCAGRGEGVDEWLAEWR